MSANYQGTVAVTGGAHCQRQVVFLFMSRILRYRSSFRPHLLTMADTNNLTPALIMSGQAQQRENGILCDIQLQTEGKLIPAHRSVLAAASPFFEAMFTSEFKEKNDTVVILNDITPNALECVIDAIYKFNLELTIQNLSEVLAASHMLQIKGIIEKCKIHMITNVGKQTCFVFLALAEKYEFKDVVSRANDFILANFTEMSKTSEFKSISKDALLYYLASDTLHFKQSEYEVFEAACQWLEGDEDRIQYVREVLEQVRFMLMTADSLGTIMSHRMVENNSECQKLVTDALVYQANIYKQPLIVSTQNRPRGKLGVLTIDGDRTQVTKTLKNPKMETKIFHGTYAAFSRVTCFVTKLQQVMLKRSLSAVQINNFLFVFGTDNDSLLPVTMRYNASTNHWIDLKPVPRQATVSSMCAIIDSYIYLFGGMFISPEIVQSFHYEKDNLTNTAHRYSILSNEWLKIEDMPQKLGKSASCSFKKMVHVCGGAIVEERTLKITKKHYALDTAASLWLTKPAMRNARAGHVMEPVDHSLYVIGGKGTAANSFVQSIESYDTESEQWTVIENTSPVGAWNASFVSDSIFITGGSIVFMKEGTPQNVRTSRIWRLDTTSKKLIEQPIRLQVPDANHVSAMMVLPKLW